MTPTRWATAVMVSGITALVLVCLGMWQSIYGYPVPAWGWLSLGIGVALSIYTPMTAHRVKREMWASGVCSREGMVWLGVVCSWIAIGVLIVIYGGAALAGSFQDVS